MDISIKHGGISLDMVCFLVEFWDEQKEAPGFALSVKVYCPSHRAANNLFEVGVESFKKIMSYQ